MCVRARDRCNALCARGQCAGGWMRVAVLCSASSRVHVTDVRSRGPGALVRPAEMVWRAAWMHLYPHDLLLCAVSAADVLTCR